MTKPLYTGDGIEAYEPAGVSGGISRLPDLWQTNQFPLEADAVRNAPWLKPPSSYLRRTEAVKVAALQDEVRRLEAENARLAALLADHENKAAPVPAVTTVADIWANALRASNGRPR